MMKLEDTNRSDLEVVILEHDILPIDTDEDLDIISKMSLEQLRSVVLEWVVEGNETEL